MDDHLSFRLIPRASMQITQCDFSDLSPCQDLAEFEFSFGDCETILGFANINGACKAISGCDSYGLFLFTSQEDCQLECGLGPCDPCAMGCPNFSSSFCIPDSSDCTAAFYLSANATTFEISDFCHGCVNFHEPQVFFGDCALPLGYALVDGECVLVDGCTTLFDLFQTIEECQSQCECKSVRPEIKRIPPTPHPHICYIGCCCTGPGFCQVDPCDAEVCDNFPDAVCTSIVCTECSAVFVSPDGLVLTPQCQSCTKLLGDIDNDGSVNVQVTSLSLIFPHPHLSPPIPHPAGIAISGLDL